jgi:predicted short-subunit dehydrogenase-like oxidoreductase (DUF2520 family)
MADKMRIAIMGMGRLGRSLHELMNETTTLQPIAWRRNEPIPGGIDVFWICVRDDAIQEVAEQIPPGSIVLHSSGALPVEVLRPHCPAGSLHPLQSFPGPEISTPSPTNLPAAIAGDARAVAAAKHIAAALGFRAFELSGDRRAYHAAAVIAGNFGTVLLAEASRLLASAGVDPALAPKLLAPLALSSIEQATQTGPAEALTGPFARGDADTIAGHLALLDEKDPRLGEIYRVLGRACLRLGQEKSILSPEERDVLFRLLG